jgi:hypothetical protein
MLEVIDMEVIDLAKSSPPMSPMSGKRKYSQGTLLK